MKIGIILSDANSPNQNYFKFIATKEVVAGQFVEARCKNKIFLGMVTNIHTSNPDYEGVTIIHHIVTKKPEVGYDPKNLEVFKENITVATGHILGTFDAFNGEFDFIGDVAEPGAEVHIAEKERLLRVLTEKEDKLFIGKIQRHPDISVELPINSLNYHLAIVGSTGSGKSYTGAVICEELANKGMPVVIIDCHGEYASLQKAASNGELEKWGLTPKAFSIVEYTPSIAYVEGTRVLSLKLSDLTPDDVLKTMEMPGAKQQILLYSAFERFLKEIESDGIEDDLSGLLRLVADIGTRGGYGDTTISTMIRLGVLNELGILGEGVKSEDLVKEGQISIINVSGLGEMAESVFVGSVIRKLFLDRRQRKIKGFVLVVEEIHRYTPAASTPTKTALSTVIKEGRKFEIGVIALSQRPSDIDTTILTQCNTIAILRLVDKADVERIRSRLGILSELADAIQFFPAGRAILSGYATHFPLIVHVRPRCSDYKALQKRPTVQKEVQKINVWKYMPKKEEKQKKEKKDKDIGQETLV